MATKADFSEEEFETLQRGVTGAGMYVSMADQDFTDSFGEARALAKYLGSQRESTSTLVRDIAAVRGTKFSFGTSPIELEQQTIESIRASVALLAEKAPDEVEAYKELVSGAAEHVAEAKGGGESAAEQGAITKINEALAAS